MKKITHPIYKDYAEQPYISPERDLIAWEQYPETFPYAIIEKKQMLRLEEGILPGDVIMLWRIGFNNFTNESVIPQYFEYRYGINSDDSIALLEKLGFITTCSATESLNILSMPILKRILSSKKLPLSGKKSDLLNRIVENFEEDELAKQFSLRRYQITDIGKNLLKKYDNIIQKHGPKM